ncbi:MAG TPA: ABC transporter substrate-binding protein [Alphaproteobacteria bacterium]|nr:ABC transporter substrate-binding protein [Alphaproteobacteria bacterium]
MRRLMLAIAVIGVAAVGILQPARAQDARKVTFLTNYVFNGRHAPFFVGLDKGYYKKAGIDIQISPASGSGFVISALDGGKADYGMADAGSVVQAIAKGAKVKGFMVYVDVTTSGLASLKPYPQPASLKGATIAASLTDSARVILPIILEMRHIDPASVKWEAADPGVYASLLLSGKADLTTASSDSDVPALEKIAAKQGKKIYFASFAKWGYDVYSYFLVAEADTLKQRPDEAKKLAQATAESVAYSVKHPEEAVHIMVKYNPTLNYDTTLTQWREAIKSIETPYVKKHGYGAATSDRLQRTIDFVKQAMQLKTNLTPGDIYAMGFTGH